MALEHTDEGDLIIKNKHCAILTWITLYKVILKPIVNKFTALCHLQNCKSKSVQLYT